MTALVPAPGGLLSIEKARALLTQCRSVQEVMRIKALAQAVASCANAEGARDEAAAIVLLAKARMGEITAELPKVPPREKGERAHPVSSQREQTPSKSAGYRRLVTYTLPVVPVREVALVHDDPPYGQAENTKRGSAGRGKNKTPGTALHGGRFLSVRQAAHAQDFPAVGGDDKPHDPAPLLTLARPFVTWGAQRYAERLPMSPSWLWWDKRDGVRSDDNGDGEMAWSNLGGPPRAWSHLWKGTCRASEVGVVHLHPTQKPIALSAWVYQRARLKRGDLVFVPHGGSGPDLPACRAAGLRLIWCEVERTHCDTAIARLGVVTAERAAEPAGPLFATAADVSPVEASVQAAERERAARPPTTAGHDAKLVGARARWRAAYGGGGR